MFSTISIVLCVLDVPLYAFHVSMILFLVAQMLRRVDQFKQGFFVVYVAVSIADCLYVSHVNLQFQRIILLFVYFLKSLQNALKFRFIKIKLLI